MFENENLSNPVQKEVLDSLDMLKMNTVFVRHCPNAFGIAFTHKTGYKITYSGDTMPCDNLVKLGKINSIKFFIIDLIQIF